MQSRFKMQEYYNFTQRWLLILLNLKFWSKNKIFFWFLKVFSIVLCFALFLVLSAQVYIKYTSKSTATNKIGDTDDKLSKRPLPCLTFCPTPGFKTGIQRLVLNSFIACAGLFLLKSLHALTCRCCPGVME